MSIIAYTPETLVSGQEYIYQTPISGLYFIRRPVYADERGYLTEPLNVEDLENTLGYPFTIRQANLSRSEEFVLRGFHAENWNKLVSVISGVAYCVLVDVRPASVTFGQKVTFWFNAKKRFPGSLYIERGIANSLCVVEGPVNYYYLVNQLYHGRDPAGDVAINLFDRDLAIDWPITRKEARISKRDAEAVSLRQMFPEKFNPA
jgi:dTDP-4-dehydrorhamnose 3,5-epimerase